MANGGLGPQAAEEFEHKEIGSQFIAAVEASTYYKIHIMRYVSNADPFGPATDIYPLRRCPEEARLSLPISSCR